MYVDVPILDRCERCIFGKRVSLADPSLPPLPSPPPPAAFRNDRICMRRAKFKRATSEKKCE